MLQHDKSLKTNVAILRGGGGASAYEGGGDARRLLRGVNFRFWSQLGCSGQNGIIFSHEGLVWGCTRKNIKIYIHSNQSIAQLYLNTVNGSESWFSDMAFNNYNL